jgi:hypothetical protein
VLIPLPIYGPNWRGRGPFSCVFEKKIPCVQVNVFTSLVRKQECSLAKKKEGRERYNSESGRVIRQIRTRTRVLIRVIRASSFLLE